MNDLKEFPDAIEVVQVLDGKRVFDIELQSKKRRYVIVPDGGFLEDKLIAVVGFRSKQKGVIQTYPTWMSLIEIHTRFKALSAVFGACNALRWCF